MASSNISPEARKEMITKKAYELYVKRGKLAGHETEDWLAAEKIVDREIQEGQNLSRAESTSSRPSVTPIRSSPGFKRVSG
jgi:hypothetical protein